MTEAAEITAAWARARRLYASQGFQKAYVRGVQARQAGKPADACPYRRRSGGGWQAWRRAWMLGWESLPLDE